MLGKKKLPNKGTLNIELMQRIDNMDDANDYNPYQAVKRTTIETNELFNDDNYDNGEEDEDKSDGSGVGIAILIVILLLIVGAILFFILR